jgi:hypothetical protein
VYGTSRQIMSISRKFAPPRPDASDIRGDVYTKTSPPRQLSPQIRKSSDEYKQLRKASPASVALPRTVKWVESLPPRIRPAILMRQFPRVANMIAASWENLDNFESYMKSLLTDQRGSREGFPPDVSAELMALETYRLAIEKGSALAIDAKPR